MQWHNRNFLEFCKLSGRAKVDHRDGGDPSESLRGKGCATCRETLAGHADQEASMDMKGAVGSGCDKASASLPRYDVDKSERR